VRGASRKTRLKDRFAQGNKKRHRTYLTPARLSSLEAQRSRRRMVLAQKYSEAPKMLNQASVLQPFLTPTASNSSPLKVLLRREFARGGSLEQTRQGVGGGRTRSRCCGGCRNVPSKRGLSASGWLVSPSLTLHTLPMLPHCQLRSAQRLS